MDAVVGLANVLGGTAIHIVQTYVDTKAVARGDHADIVDVASPTLATAWQEAGRYFLQS